MLKKILLYLLLFLSWQLNANAADLVEVYQRALYYDPTFQQVIAKTLVTEQNVPISIAAILPKIFFFMDPSIARHNFTGSNLFIGTINNTDVFTPRNFTQRGYNLSLTLSEPIFNFSLYNNIAIQLQNAKSAKASLNFALQNLMVRVSNAYFAILRDEESITYTLASMRYYRYQLEEIKHQFQVGLRTITDVYTAQSSYDASSAAYIVAKKTLANDKEVLRAITGIYYTDLSSLKNNFPLIFPNPNHINQWVHAALVQNWAIKAAQYAMEAAKQNIRSQFSGHLPTIALESGYNRKYNFNINRYTSYIDRGGPGTVGSKYLELNINVPVFEGGGVLAKTTQALHNYEQQQEFLEETVRTTIKNTRQSFMNIVAGISQIKADLQIIKSSAKSLEGTIASYQIGALTLIDVLNQEEKLYQAQLTYITNRYEFINNILLLKQAAGTLSFDDLRLINCWLSNEKDDHSRPYQDTLLRNAKKNVSNKETVPQPSRQNISSERRRYDDNHVIEMLNQIRQENREAYKKLEDRDFQSRAEIKALKSTLAEVKKGLVDKNNQLKTASQQINQLEGRVNQLKMALLHQSARA